MEDRNPMLGTLGSLDAVRHDASGRSTPAAPVCQPSTRRLSALYGIIRLVSSLALTAVCLTHPWLALGQVPHWAVYHESCVEDSIYLAAMVESVYTLVVEDPGESDLDWKIQLKGNALESIAITLKKPPARPEQLSGQARLDPDGSVIAVNGDSTILNVVPCYGTECNSARIIPKFFSASISGASNLRKESELVINQVAGTQVLNTYSVALALKGCRDTHVSPDDRDLLHVDPEDANTVFALIDGRTRLADLDDRLYAGTTPLVIPNLRESDYIPSEIVTFGGNRAPRAQRFNWSVKPGEEMTIQMPEAIGINIYGWVATADLPVGVKRLRNLAAVAEMIFRQNSVGVSFNLVTCGDCIDEGCATRLQCPEKLDRDVVWNASRCQQPEIQKLLSSSWYREDGFNVYVTDSGSNMACFTAAPGSGVIFLRNSARDETLAHEIGHWFGLQPDEASHTTGRRGFGNSNVMWEDDDTLIYRRHFTLGQVFRMHADARSLLQTWGVSSVMKRICRPFDVSHECPPYEFDTARPFR